jgi:hypothetical protein
MLANADAIGALNVCANAEILMGKTTIGAKHALIGFSDDRRTLRFFDLRRVPPHTLRATSRWLKGGAFVSLPASP